MWCLDREGALLQVLPIMLKLCCLLLRALSWGYWHGQSFPHQFGDILTAALLATGHALAVVRSLVGGEDSCLQAVKVHQADLRGAEENCSSPVKGYEEALLLSPTMFCAGILA